MASEQLPIDLAAAVASPSIDTTLEDALAVFDDDDPRELCPNGCGEVVYPRRRYAHLPKCRAADHSPFGGNTREVPTA